MTTELPIVGLIPAAGLAQRLGPLPCSKERLPVGFAPSPSGPRPKPVCLYLLERMTQAGIERAFLVLRSGKWDIPAYLGDGERLGMRLAYLLMNLPYGAPYTLDQAYAFVRGCVVALGFPDIIFEPADAYRQLLERLHSTGADVVLGLFPAEQPQSSDLVAAAADGRVARIEIKPPQSDLTSCWMIAVWGPSFTEFLHGYLAERERRAGPAAERSLDRELYIGEVIQAGIEAGLHVNSVAFPHGSALDVGTPSNLQRAVRRYAADEVQ